MKKLISIFCMAIIGFCVLTGCSSKKEELVVALLPTEDGQESAANELFIKAAQEALKDDVIVKGVVCDDYASVIEAVLTGSAQMAYGSGATFAAANLEDEDVVAILTYGKDGKLDNAVYQSLIITNSKNKGDFEGKSTAEKMEQLKSKSFAFVAATSTSGCLVPSTSMYLHFGPEGSKEVKYRSDIIEKKYGEGGIFEEIQFGTSHAGNLNLVAEEKVYAGTVSSNAYKAYENKDRIYVIDSQDVPNGPVFVNKKYIKQEYIDKFVNYFVAMTPNNSVEGFFDPVNGYFSSQEEGDKFRYVKIDTSFYDFAKEMYKIDKEESSK